MSKVARLEHGLEKYLNGELVFGDEGVKLIENVSEDKDMEEITQKLSGYIEPYKDQKLL